MGLQKPRTFPLELKSKQCLDMKATLLCYPDTPMIELQTTRFVYTVFYDPVNLYKTVHYGVYSATWVH